MRLHVPVIAVLLASCRSEPLKPAPKIDKDFDTTCPAEGHAMARVMTADDQLPGETAVGTAGDLILQNGSAAFVITEPDKGSTYYHYGGIVADAVAMDGCDVDGEDKLDEIGLVIAQVDLTSIASSILRGFRGESIEVISDGSDGEAAVVRVTGVDDTYWVVEYTLIEAAMDEGGKALSEPFGVEIVVDYTLEPDSPVLRIDLSITNQSDAHMDLVAASLLSFGGTMDLDGYAPATINALGFELDYGMPWLVASDGQDALAYGVEDGSLAYMGISGIEVAIDVTQALADPISIVPGQTDTRTMFLSVGAGAGTSATAPLAEVNPEPSPDQPYTLGFASGRVLDPDGRAVPGVSLAVQAKAPGASWGVMDVAITDEDGAFDVPLPVFGEPWEWRLVADGAGRDTSDPLELSPGDTDLVLPVSALGSLRVDIVDQDGAPSPARLRLDRESDGARVDLWLEAEGAWPVAPGTYEYTATRGYEFASVSGTLVVPDDGEVSLELEMDHVVDTAGFVSVDTHVHSWDSPDSRVSPSDVLRHAAAHGLDIVVHTEHEHLVDRVTLPREIGVDAWVGSIPGEEVTATIPEHLTMFPASPDGSPRGGIVDWYGKDLDQIFGEMRDRSAGGVNLLNHPSYLNRIGWDRLLAEPTLDDPTLLGLAPDAALWSWNLDGMEVMNGHRSPFDSGNGRWEDWQSMVNAGHPIIAVGCSDDHGGNEVGFPRTYVPASTDDGDEVPDQEVVDAFHAGQAVASAGAFARVRLDDGASLGELGTADAGEVVLNLHVEALPEVDVSFISVFVNCDEVVTLAATDRGGVVKFSEAIPLTLTEDANITAAAFGEGYLPLGLPQYNPDKVPRVLTNPIYVDVDGNGVFDAPGGHECVVFLDGPVADVDE
jgi:hypothetical protein